MNILVTLPLRQDQKDKIEAAAKDANYTYCLPDQLTEETLKGIDIILGNLPPKWLAYADSLKWLQLNNAGTEGFCSGALPEGAILTNATGAYGLAISEHMIGMLFEIRKKLHIYRENQLKKDWRYEGNVTAIEGSTVLVIGLGDIGRTFAKKMKGLGCTVIGVKRRPGVCPEYVDELHLNDKLDELIPRADIIALSVPGNEDTRHILSAERIALMQEKTIVLNVGRGYAIDTDALLKALQEKKIAGAGLDVTDPEPLPTDHPLWETENTVITPHVSGRFSLPETLEKIVDICADNLDRYVKGEPLKNVIDFATGYVK